MLFITSETQMELLSHFKTLIFNISFLCHDTISQKLLLPNICVLHDTLQHTAADLSKNTAAFLKKENP